jgi:hypothetical protein
VGNYCTWNPLELHYWLPLTSANAHLPTPPPAASRHCAPPTCRSQRLLTAARRWMWRSIRVMAARRPLVGWDFSPDFVWYKQRNGSYGHDLYDIVRGTGNILNTNNTLAEYSDANRLTAFNSDGFSLGSSAAANGSGSTYVAWTWDAGSSTVTNTEGSITCQVRANASAGFSVVTYTGNGSSGATIGHGLGVKPALIITKNRDASDNWVVQHTSQGAGKAGYLNTADAFFTSSFWNSTEPTSSVFSVGNQSNVNGSGVKLVAYCFAPVAGYSSFGSYTGNGSADGPFVFYRDASEVDHD